MAKLIVAPLSTVNGITRTVAEAIYTANERGFRLILQTEKHITCSELLKANLQYETMDDLYTDAIDFDDLNTKIAQRLINGSDTVYVPLGRGISGELLDNIKTLAESNSTQIVLLPSSGFSESAAAAIGFNMAGGDIVFANSLPDAFDIKRPLAIEEIDSRLRAGEVKLALCEYYPDESDVMFMQLSDRNDYICRTIKLYELDRQNKYGADTVLLISPLDYQEAERYGLDGLIWIMERLRAPDGCPWDIKQTHETLKTPLIEEAYEVLDAIQTGDMDSLCEELGDLLLQIVFHAQIEREHAGMNMRDICTGIVQKLIYRHPHVFTNAKKLNSSDEVLVAWEKLKKAEKHQNSQTDVMNSVPKSFPALMRSFKVQKRAADVGFDWNDPYEALQKIDEEKREVLDAHSVGDPTQLELEIGDLLFSVVNVSRLFKIDPELALSAATDKFVYRFSVMEKLIKDDGLAFEGLTLETMDTYWSKAKMM